MTILLYSLRAMFEFLLLPEKRIFVHKGWGWEDWIWNSEQYCGKILFVQANKKCSWHYHVKKDETFYVISGELLVLLSDNDDIESAHKIILKPGHGLHLSPGTRHQFSGIVNTQFVEFSTQHFDDDSIRIIKGN